LAKSENIDRRTISIHCAKCRSLLYKYRKGGRGGLVKCLVERIAEDFTNGDLHCHSCGQQFARPMSLPGQSAHKIIQGKVYTKGMARK
jgi:ribosomal protein S27E